MVFKYGKDCVQLPHPPIYKRVSIMQRLTPLFVTIFKYLF